VLIISQQGFTIVSLEGGIDVGDFEYIEGKVVAGDYFHVSGDIDAINDTIEFIPASGKTALLIEAKIVITGHVDPAPFPSGSTPDTQNVRNMVEAELIIDSVVEDTTNIGFNSRTDRIVTSGTESTSNNYGHVGDGRFNVLGLSLVGNAAKKIEIKNALDDGSAFATMSGYVRDT